MLSFSLKGGISKRKIIALSFVLLLILLLAYNLFLYNINSSYEKIDKIEYCIDMNKSPGEREFIIITDKGKINNILNPYRNISFYRLLKPISSSGEQDLYCYNDDKLSIVLSTGKIDFVENGKAVYKVAKWDADKLKEANNNSNHIVSELLGSSPKIRARLSCAAVV